MPDQRLRRAHQFLDIGIKEFTVADDFELDPVGVERFARELGGEHGVLGGLAAGGVGKKADAPGEQIEQALVVAGEADAADRGGDHLGAARADRVEHDLAIGITGGAEKKPRAELLAGNDERIGHLLHLTNSFPSPLWGGVRGGGREATAET